MAGVSGEVMLQGGIVLFGGTFNPIHKGHLSLCRQVFGKVHPKEIVLIPSGHPPHKREMKLAPAYDRLNMCRLAVVACPFISVDDFETKGSGPCYTVDTLHHMKRRFPSEVLYMLMSTDVFLSFDSWYRWKECAKIVTLLVGSRLPGDLDIQLIQQKRLGLQGVRSVLLMNRIVQVSSSEIRKNISCGNSTDLVSREVRDYIDNKDLYR